MKLTDRLTMFFVLALAGVLMAFSLTLYLLARHHVLHQANEQLDAALNTLIAAAEVKPEGVEWEPGERLITPGSGQYATTLVWTVTDGNGHPVGQSQRPETESFRHEGAFQPKKDEGERCTVNIDGSPWLTAQRWITPLIPQPGRPPTEPPGPHEVLYPALVITAALSLEPAYAEMRRLATTLAGISLVVLAGALLASRLVCRRALLPLRTMAAEARDMQATELGQRLQLPGHRDELDDLGQSFNDLLNRVQESFERQKRFTGDASHQLRTPLAAMRGQLEVALRRGRTTGEYQQTLTTVLAKTEHLQRIIEALLFLSRAEADAPTPGEETIDLVTWLPDYFESWSEHPRFCDLHLEIAAESLMVRTNTVLFGELLNVLIDNACRYSPAGTPIILSVAEDFDLLRLEVTDQGVGIPELERQRVFSPFFRADDALRANKAGIGLGLAIAKRIAVTLGGVLQVDDNGDCGSRFSFVMARKFKEPSTTPDSIELAALMPGALP